MPRPRQSGPASPSAVGLAAGALLLLAPPTSADRVVLVNGKVFEDVTAEIRETTVAIQIGGGALTLAKDQVASIETAPSTAAEYERRGAALRARGGAANEWLELARWARGRGFGFGAREAALAAAEIAPRLAGLEPLMRSLGYEWDEATGGWFPFAEAMRRRGWVEDGDEWVPAEVAEARQRARAEASAERRRAAEAARLERLTTLAELQLTRELARPEPPAWGYPYWPVWGVPIVAPGPIPPRPQPGPGPEPPPQLAPRPGRSTHNGILDRQPGSLIPVAPPR